MDKSSCTKMLKKKKKKVLISRNNKTLKNCTLANKLMQHYYLHQFHLSQTIRHFIFTIVVEMILLA